MYSTILTAVLKGICTIPVTVEVDISDGMPVFEMVGNLSSEVKEAKERVRTALHNCGILLPAKRITINLAPAQERKSGTGFDLPIAVALLCSMGLVEERLCQNRIFAGELGLNGQILPVNGVLPIVSDGKNAGIEEFVVPEGNEKEATLVQNVKVYGFSNLKDVIDFLNGKKITKKPSPTSLKIPEKTMDFSEVNGQNYLKRACEIAAAGMHNLLLIGPPGAGKTMISERLSTILPPLTEEEQLELSKIYSVCGLLKDQESLITERPFRSPHHTITKIGLAGGGTMLRPGEISLAHKGVLFLDELPEFQKASIEILRQPLEEKQVRLVRARGSVTYPADFLLLASMNPCNCGYYPNMQKCRCTPGSIKRYLERISQPFLDRMDICAEAVQISYKELTGTGTNETSAQIRERVVRCHEIQRARFQNESFCYNSRIPASRLKEYCQLGEIEENYMEHIYEEMSLTARTYHKILRVARTIADLEGSEQVRKHHLNEAVCFRTVDQKFWGGI